MTSRLLDSLATSCTASQVSEADAFNKARTLSQSIDSAWSWSLTSHRDPKQQFCSAAAAMLAFLPCRTRRTFKLPITSINQTWQNLDRFGLASQVRTRITT